MAEKPIIMISIDLRLTADDLARLNAEQIAAVFAGVGQLAALTHGQPERAMTARPNVLPCFGDHTAPAESGGGSR